MAKEATERQYKEIAHSWTDIWDDKEVTVSYRFSRPSAADIKRMQSGAVKNASAAARDLMMSTIHEEDKDRFIAESEKYPGIVTTLSAALIRASGIADLGN